MTDLQAQFGNIDIYLFDQLLRSRIVPGIRILDAGCGFGRNLVYFLREGYDVYGIDHDLQSIEECRRLATLLNPRLPLSHFKVETLEALHFPDAFFDLVITSAVLHFARDDKHFNQMLTGLWRVLKPGGTLFCRLASSIGIEKQVKRIAGRRYLLPDGSDRYLVDEKLLLKLTKHLNAELSDPIKTTIVQNQRSMTTWITIKRGQPA
jgi:SAM-dependent methyltransferase